MDGVNRYCATCAEDCRQAVNVAVLRCPHRRPIRPHSGPTAGTEGTSRVEGWPIPGAAPQGGYEALEGGTGNV